MDYTPISHPTIPDAELSKADFETLDLDSKHRIIAQRQLQTAYPSLIESLIKLGEFDEAILLCGDKPALQDLKSRAELIKAAMEADDGERCTENGPCAYEIDRADYTRDPDAIPKMEARPNYLLHMRFWSQKHGQMVNLWICHVCGHAQAIPGHPDQAHADHWEKITAQAARHYPS